MQLNVKYLIARNIKVLLATVVTLFVVTVVYSAAIHTSILNTFFAPFELNYDKAFSESNYVTAKTMSSLKSDNSWYTAEQFYNSYFKNRYRQGDKYVFSITPDNVYDLNFYSEPSYDIDIGVTYTAGRGSFNQANYILLKKDGLNIIAKVDPGIEITPGRMYTGVLRPLTSELLSFTYQNMGPGSIKETFLRYQLDTDTNYRLMELPYMSVLYLLIIVTLTLLILYILYSKNYKKHPTYKQLNKYYGTADANENSLNSELAVSYGTNGRQKVYRTAHWTVRRGLYKTTIIKAAGRT